MRPVKELSSREERSGASGHCVCVFVREEPDSSLTELKPRKSPVFVSGVMRGVNPGCWSGVTSCRLCKPSRHVNPAASARRLMTLASRRPEERVIVLPMRRAARRHRPDITRITLTNAVYTLTPRTSDAGGYFYSFKPRLLIQTEYIKLNSAYRFVPASLPGAE